MTEPVDARVAVYIDFDNIVISRYDQVNGRGHFHRDKVRSFAPEGDRRPKPDRSEEATKVEQATVDISAVLDYASSFGSIVISRAYADWSVPVNSSYRRQLMDRAVDLVQLFPAVASMKNGADIRLSIDVVEDLFRLDDLTHVVIVAGDSDYIPLAQRAKRLGRYVVGIGVAGSTSKHLAAACDEFADYDALLTMEEEEPRVIEEAVVAAAEEVVEAAAAKTPDKTAEKAPTRKRGPRKTDAATPDESPAAEPESELAVEPPTSRRAQQAAQQAASNLLVRALRLGHAKDDQEWLGSSNVKNQMLRMDPSFQESALGYKSFTDFVQSRGNLVELQEDGQVRRLRLRPSSPFVA
ncbi:NYN domain-containing protein [Salinibacterium sp. ZJ454]|uniref:NYN domain-containing protein n=1 Tax=Salinibacterium sp. ZJ454 TaxID=2708339 RepID=UPI001422FE72|nr:NYN domain-containing protein [Salinibacterium sp. ZJ454]